MSLGWEKKLIFRLENYVLAGKIKFLSFTNKEYQSKCILKIATQEKKEYIVSISEKIRFQTKSSEKDEQGNL